MHALVIICFCWHSLYKILQDVEDLRLTAMQHTYLSPHLETYVMNLFLAVRHHSSLEASLLSMRCTQDMEDFVRSARILFGSPGPLPDMPQTSLEFTVQSPEQIPMSLYAEFSCTERDVARVFAGVLAHRLSVQQPVDGPLHSLVLPAVDTSNLLEDKEGHVKPDGLDSTAPTVHSILAGILHSI